MKNTLKVDKIMCRNVMLYFVDETTISVLHLPVNTIRVCLLQCIILLVYYSPLILWNLSCQRLLIVNDTNQRW